MYEYVECRVCSGIGYMFNNSPLPDSAQRELSARGLVAVSYEDLAKLKIELEALARYITQWKEAHEN